MKKAFVLTCFIGSIFSLCMFSACSSGGGGGGNGGNNPTNRAPAANAGPDQSSAGGVLVTLDGAGSSDPDGDILTYSWTQTAGPNVVLSDAAAAKPTFTAPQAGADDSALSFQLTVSDGTLTDDDTMVVSISAAAMTIEISGNVYLGGDLGEAVTPGEGVAVRATSDLDGNGEISLNEEAVGTVDANGSYSLTVAAKLNVSTVVSFEKTGYAKQMRTISLGSPAPVSVNATLAKMKSLDCGDSGCRDSENSVQVKGVEISSGYAKVFNPAADTDKFPGSFADDQGNQLVSGVFGTFDLVDGDGNPITELPADQKATIRMKVSQDTWPSFTDITPGNGRIDVPMYSFDETTGEWVRDGDGWLETAEGTALDESLLDQIKDQTYPNALYAVAEVSHFSYWNVDWPIATHASVRLRFIDDQGQPVPNAVATIHGTTFTGTVGPLVADAEGVVCFDSLRSELAGEDINDNQVEGEVQKVIVKATSNGVLYRSQEIELPTEQSSCPESSKDADIALSPENEVDVVVCSVTGHVYLDGVAQAGVTIFGADDGLDPSSVQALCASRPNGFCNTIASTDENGAYAIEVPMASDLKVYAMFWTSDDIATMWYNGTKTLASCPSAPVDINIEREYCLTEKVLTVQYDAQANNISWTPEIPVGTITSIDNAGYDGYKWMLTSDDGMTSPVVYGTTPNGAGQGWPLDGAPPADIASGDVIMITPLNGLVPYNGFSCYQIWAETTVP